MMPINITFINTTQDAETRTPGVTLSRVQSHLATTRHAKARATRRRKQEKNKNHGEASTSRAEQSTSTLGDCAEFQAGIEVERLLKFYRGHQGPSYGITSSLDPFLRLPLDLGPSERSLIHFWLLDGRCLFWAMNRTPRFCPALHWSMRFFESAPVHVLVFRLTAESVLCRVRQQDLSTSFYTRRAQTYKGMNDLISSDEADFHYKMSAFLAISILEYSLGRPDLQAKHVHTMDHYMQDHGGVSMLVSKTIDDEYVLDPPWFVAHFMYNTTPKFTDEVFSTIVHRLTQAMTNIRTWTSTVTTTHDPSKPISPTTPSLAPLRTYLTWVLTTYFDPNNSFPCSLSCGALHLLLGLILTQVIYAYDRPTSLTFLQRVQSCFEESSSTPLGDSHPATTKLHPGAAGTMMGYIRYAVKPKNNDNEVEISQLCIDGMRLLPLLSRSSRHALAKNLVRCVFAVMDEDAGDYFGTQFVEDLEGEIRRAWAERDVDGGGSDGFEGVP